MRAAKHEAGVFPLAALCLLAENSHRGHRLPTAVLHEGFTPVNSNTATGFDAFLYDEGRRSRSTGKERDAETGLDYFGARYFSSPMGRFVSADWAAVPQAVPYANLADPQTLNLYGYVRNNPMAKADADGHGVQEEIVAQFQIVAIVYGPRIVAAAAETSVLGAASGARIASGVVGGLFAVAMTAGVNEVKVLNELKSRQQANKQKANANEAEKSPEKEAEVQAGSSGEGGKKGGRKGKRPPDATQSDGVEAAHDTFESIHAAQDANRKLGNPEMIGETSKTDKKADYSIEKARKEHNAGQPNP